ncbi:MAG TPA: ankyrin repeat domain-containing protein [Blastocatellia bacterium]|nr:ankyrin repeat domain-containing protein [Blastocatellia bacterium]
MPSRLSNLLKHLAIASFIGTIGFSLTPAQRADATVDFRRDVQPILKQFCIECHGPSQQMHGFRLDRRRDAMRGGTATVIVPGNGATSRLYLKLIGNKYGPQMPPTGPLTAEQIEIIKTWIDQGAEWPDDLAGDMPPPAPDPQAAPIMKALRDGDRRTFKKLASQDQRVGNRRGVGGITPLMQAVLYGDAVAVRLLLERGADPNLRDDAGATALMWAVDDLEKTRLLIAHGADVNARSDDARTPLLIAAGRFDNTAVVRLLLDHGADLSAKSPATNGFQTVLSEAARSGDEALLRMLIERGADVKSAGVLALLNANRSGCAKCLELLAEGADRRTLMLASSLLLPPLGDGRATRLLLDKGADAKLVEPKGNTLLILAAGSDAMPVESVKALLARGADVNAKNPDGRTALDFAKMRGATPIIHLLTEAGAKEGTATVYTPPAPVPAPSIRAALERSIPLLQKTDLTFMQKSGCVSCHNNTMTAVTVAAVRQVGIAVNEEIARGQVKKIAAFLETWRERTLQGAGIPGESGPVSAILGGLAAEHYPADAATDAMARYVASQQWPDGRWRPFGHRPPLEVSDIPITARALRALQVYAPKTQRTQYDRAIRRAADWLAKAQPQTTDEYAFQLLGLGWAGMKPGNVTIKKAVRELLAEQRPDGGWGQIAALASDAYATGEVLVALRQAGGVAVTDAAYRHGIEFLLKTQLEDGSWYVRSRAVPLQPFFEAGFPHGRDQWISAAATNWAALALTLAAH